MLEIKVTKMLFFGNNVIHGISIGVKGCGIVKNKIIGGDVSKEVEAK